MNDLRSIQLVDQLRRVADAHRVAIQAEPTDQSDAYERAWEERRQEVSGLRVLCVELGINIDFVKEALS